MTAADLAMLHACLARLAREIDMLRDTLDELMPPRPDPGPPLPLPQPEQRRTH